MAAYPDPPPVIPVSDTGAAQVQASPGRSRGLGWRIHESVEDTKLSTNKQHTLSLGLLAKQVRDD